MTGVTRSKLILYLPVVLRKQQKLALSHQMIDSLNISCVSLAFIYQALLPTNFYVITHVPAFGYGISLYSHAVIGGVAVRLCNRTFNLINFLHTNLSRILLAPLTLRWPSNIFKSISFQVRKAQEDWFLKQMHINYMLLSCPDFTVCFSKHNLLYLARRVTTVLLKRWSVII